jgi:hypothetical protein
MNNSRHLVALPLIWAMVNLYTKEEIKTDVFPKAFGFVFAGSEELTLLCLTWFTFMGIVKSSEKKYACLRAARSALRRMCRMPSRPSTLTSA